MNLYSITLILHVVTAVVGVGLLGAVPIGARIARRDSIELATLAKFVQPISRYARISLLVMLLSGAAMDLTAAGALHENWWFRASVLALILAGIAHGLGLAALRRGLAGKIDDSGALRGLEAWGWTSCVAVSCIAYLMELKPF